MRSKTQRLLVGMLCVAMTLQSVPFAVLADVDSVAENAGVEAVFAEPSADDETAVSFDRLYTDESVVEGIDFSSKRLLIGDVDPTCFTSGTAVLADYDGVYMLGFADEFSAKSAYTYYYDLAGFVEPDLALFTADDEYVNTASMLFSDLGNDAFTHLRRLADAGEQHYDIAIIDTGIANGAADAVSVLGGEGVDDNGHGTAVYSAIKSVSDDLSVLSVKAFDQRGIGYVSGVYAAMCYAVAQGVDVINLSVAAESTTDSVLLNRAVRKAADAGIVVVGAAGNEGADASGFVPARLNGVYIAGACDETGVMRSNSNYGEAVFCNAAADSTSEAAAKLSAMIAVYGTEQVLAEMNQGILFETDYTPAENETVIGVFDENARLNEKAAYTVYDRLNASQPQSSPWLKESELTDATLAAIQNDIAAIAEESEGQVSQTVDNTTIQRLTVRWLTKSTGEDTPAYYDTLELKPTTDTVEDQQFQIDFALSGQQAYEPGQIELVFPASIWKDREGNEAGVLTLSIPEGPEANAEFVWTRQGDKIVVTNAKKIAAASKVMIQGTFRNLTAHEMKDMYGKDGQELAPFDPAEFAAYLTVVTPLGNQISMSSNTIEATIDTSVEVTYAAKTAYNSTAKSYDLWWKGIPEEIPAELLPANPENYMYIRWYVSGTAAGNQPFDMYVSDTIAMDDDGEPLYGGIMLGISEAANGVTVQSADGKTVSAPLYSGYSTAPKSAYVWTAYPKTGENCLPQDREITIPNTQTISVVGKDDGIRTTMDAPNSVKTKSPSDYVFEKVWDDEDNKRGVRPDMLYLDIYRDDYSATNAWKTVTMNRSYETEPNGNMWKYSWSDEGQVCKFDVRERLVRYTGVVGDPLYDDKGHEQQWSYYLSKTAYDEDTRTWTYTNTYKEELVDFDVERISKFVEYNFRDPELISTRDSLSLNKLLNGEKVLVDYTVSTTVSAALQSVWHGVTPNRFVLEDGTYMFDDRKMSIDDVEIGKFTFDLPIVYEYLPGNGQEPDWRQRRVVAETPDTHLYGLVGEVWTLFATLHTDGTITAENDAEIEGWMGTTIALPEKVSAIRLELESEYAAAKLGGIVALRVKPTDTVKEIIRHGFETGDYQVMKIYNKADAYVEYAGDDTKTVDGTAYKKGTRYNELWAHDTGYLHGRVFKVAADLTKSFELTDNNPATRMITMASELTLTQQSNVLSQDDYLLAIANHEIPNTNSGTYYDLLPVGVDPILDSVKAGGNDTVLDKWLVPNYQDSGRTLLVVKVKLVDCFSQTTMFSPKRYTENNYPEEGYKNTHTLTFNSTCTWEIAQNRENLTNMHNVSAYQADEGEVGSLEFWKGETGDLKSSDNNLTPSAFSGNEKQLMANLDSTDSNPSFVYAGANLSNVKADFSAVTGLDKSVQVTGSGVWSKGLDNDVNVQESGLYSYRLRITSGGDTQTSDIILLDSLENYKPHDVDPDTDDTQWRGKLLSIDLSQVKAAGVAPVVYYNTTKDGMDISKYHDVDDNGNIKDKDETYVQRILEAGEFGWQKMEGTLSDAERSKITAIAIDMRKGTDNKDFVLASDQTLIVTLNMKAPYDQTTDQPDYFKETDGTDHLKNAHAYNAVYLDCKQEFDYDADVKQTHSYINYSYTKVGIYTKYLDIVKEWDDNDDSDGKRPDQIIVRLMGDGKQLGDAIVLSEETGWKGKSDRLLTYNDDGSYIRYTFEEEFKNQDAYPDMTVKRETLPDGTEKATIINRHEPEKISIPVIKLWDDENDKALRRPSAITVELYANGAPTGKTLTIRPDDNGNWSGTFTNLDKYHNKGEMIEYTIVEDVDDYKCSDTVMTRDEANGIYTIQLTNTYHPIGSLRVTKKLENATDAAKKENKFGFTLRMTTMVDGEELAVTNRYAYEILESNGDVAETGTIGDGDEFALMDGQTFVIPEMPTHILYSVEETGNQSGFTLTGVSGESGEIRSARPAEAVFTNTYAAKGNAQLKVKKVLTGRKLAGYQFKFELKDAEGNVLRTAYNNADGDAIFGNIGYTDADVDKEFFYTISEVQEVKPGYTYSKEVHRVKVTPCDIAGKGTLECKIEYLDLAESQEYPVITNEYHAKGELAFRAWKTLVGGSVGDKKFGFELYGADGTMIGSRVQNNGNGIIDFEKINYTEEDIGKVYWYYVRETAGNDQTIIYDTAVIGYRVEVVDNGDGTLSFDQSAYYVYKMCDACRGTGVEYKTCDECSGSGKIGEAPCEVCSGSGAVAAGECEICSGNGGLMAHEFASFCVNCNGRTGEDCDLCGGLGFRIVPCPDCGGTGETANGICAACSGKGTSLPASSDIPVFDNGLEDGGITVAKYTDDGSPDQEFRFKVVLEGRDLDDMEGEFEVAPADARPFPAKDAPQTAPSPKPVAARASVARAAEARAAVRAIAARPAVVQLAAENEIMPLADHGDVVDGGKTANNQVSWTLYTDGTLVLKPADGVTNAVLTANGTSLGSTFPWTSLNLRTQITTVEIEGKIYAQNLCALFYNCENLTDIIGWENLVITNSLSNTSYLFYGCRQLNIPDLSNWITDKVTNMSYMFYNCKKLVTANFGKWNINSVTSMASMFYGCEGLTVADFSGWDTWRVSSVSYMFISCPNIFQITICKDFYNYDDQYNKINFFVDNWYRFDTGEGPYNDDGLRSLALDGNVTFIRQQTNYIILFEQGDPGDTVITGSMATVQRNPDLDYTIPACGFEHDGYVLKEWDDGLGHTYAPGGTIEAGTYKSSQIITLTAIWQKPEYTVKFEVGDPGATGEMPNRSVSISEPFTVPECTFMYFGHVFMGWLREDTNEILRPGEVIPAGTFEADDVLTLIAKWEISKKSFTMKDGAFEFTLHGGYQATFKGLPAGTTYQIYEESEFGWVLVASSDTSGTIEPLQFQKAQFYNRYTPGVITAQISASKYLDGTPAAADANNEPFRFALYNSDAEGTRGDLIEQVEAQNGGLIRFRALEYTEENKGTHYYIMKELPGENTTLAYDEREVLVTVEVIDETQAGEPLKLATKVTYSLKDDTARELDRVVFENTTKPGSLEITKHATGTAEAKAEAEFQFRVKLYGTNGMPMRDGTIDWRVGNEYSEKNVLTNGEIIVSCKADETIILENLPAGTTYEIEEINIPTGWTLDETDGLTGEIKAAKTEKASFTNIYSAEGHTTITLHKLFQGGALEAGMFNFELYALVGQASSHTSNIDANGQPTGQAIGTDLFTETVKIPNATKLTVTVPDLACSVGGALYLVAGSYTGGIPANGAYAHKITQADTKAYDIDGDTVTFVFVSNGTSSVYYSADVAGLSGEPIKVSNSMVDNRETVYDENADETVPNQWLGYAPIVFDGLVFTAPGKYTYYIREIADENADDIIFDDHAEIVEINVKDNGKGLLTVEDKDIHYLGREAFVNNSAGQLTVSKTLLINDKVPDSVKNMEFDFMVELRDADGVLLTDVFAYTVYDSDDKALRSGTITANTDYISIKGGQKFTIFDLPNGTMYNVTEQSVTGIELESSVGASGTVTSGAAHTASFTNVYAGSAALALNAHKRFEGGKISENMFAFELKSGSDVLQTVYADTNGNITFDPIIFTTADLNRKYTYTIREVNGGLSSIQYDMHEAVICVEIKRGENGFIVVNLLDDSGNEVLMSDSELTLTEETVSALAFTNATFADLTVTKTVVGDYDDESFGFNLFLENAAGLPENIVWQKGDESGVIRSGNLPYAFALKANETIVFSNLPLGTAYTVVETDHPGYTATVGDDRTDTAEGVITGSGDNTAAFVNIASVYASPEATKTLTGRAMKDGEFSFTISADKTDGIKLPADTTVKNENGKVRFGQIEFTKEGKYEVTLTEIIGEDTHIRFAEPIMITYTVEKDAETGELRVSADKENSELIFANVYTPDSVYATPEAAKTLTGRTLKDGEFSFTISADKTDGIKLPADTTVKNENGKVRFGQIEFTEPGTYKVTLREVVGDDEHITYAKPITITYTVEKNAETGELRVSADKENSELIFANVYTPDSVYATPEATKTLTGRALKDGEFSFTISADKTDGIKLPADTTVKNENGKVRFGQIEFTEPGTYKVTLREEIGDDGHIKYADAITVTYTVEQDAKTGELRVSADKENSELIFANVYTPDSVYATPEATKTLTGRALKDGEFSFTISADKTDGIKLPADTTVKNENGKVRFGQIEFTEPGTYKVTLREVVGDDEHITYAKPITITYTVEKNAETGELRVSADKENSELIFANVYTPDSVYATPEATKILTGRTLTDGEFTFKMVLASAVDSDGNTLTDGITMPAALTAKNDGEGKITFARIKFSKIGTYTINISEEIGSDETITYDKRVFSVVYEVKKTSGGELEVETTYLLDGARITKPVFQNRYTETTTSVTTTTTTTTSTTSETTTTTTTTTSKMSTTTTTTTTAPKMSTTTTTTTTTSKMSTTTTTTTTTPKTSTTTTTTTTTPKTSTTTTTTTTTPKTSTTTTTTTTTTPKTSTTTTTTTTTPKTSTTMTTTTTTPKTSTTTTTTTTTPKTSTTTTTTTTTPKTSTTTTTTTTTPKTSTTTTTTTTTPKTSATTTTTTTTPKTSATTTTTTTPKTSATTTTTTTPKTSTTTTTTTTPRTSTTTTSQVTTTTTAATSTTTSADTTEALHSTETTMVTSNTSDPNGQSTETDDSETTTTETTATEENTTTATTGNTTTADRDTTTASVTTTSDPVHTGEWGSGDEVTSTTISGTTLPVDETEDSDARTTTTTENTSVSTSNTGESDSHTVTTTAKSNSNGGGTANNSGSGTSNSVHTGDSAPTALMIVAILMGATAVAFSRRRDDEQ